MDAIYVSSPGATVWHETGPKLRPPRNARRRGRVNSLIWIALVLFVLWIVVRVVFAITSFVFHLLWVVALILLIVWLVRRFL